MDYKIEGLSGLVTTRLRKSVVEKDDELCLKDEDLCFPKSLLPLAILLWVNSPQKALSLLHIFYGDVKKGYELYKRYPYSTRGKICWIHKRLAKAVEQIINGAGRVKILERLEGEIRRRWPNVCYEIDNTDLALSLVENLREAGFDVSLTEKDDELIMKSSEGVIKFRKRDASDHFVLLELLSLKPQEAMRIVEGLGSDESCEGLRKFVRAISYATNSPHILSLLLKKARELDYQT